MVVEAEGTTGPRSGRVVGPGTLKVSPEPGASRLEITL